ncbi:signal recognition particle-docking protein FtsY [Oceanibacterium hippocampi]|uniref:Signal recognition particle receptor FtsY n=1 Tax=Oceanibacterium hippocampi TaxID=745714 RepID=A0A1Y5RDJ1_9PROT|nr:signal recognition particle-docking protein FtsY [Oceanibacterium hippocampi]SLN14609.1 Signal recognition particle receptor FtsY [Oceanibacterium hippocampi]
MAAAEEKARKGWFGRLKDGLKRSSSALTEGIGAIFTKRKLDSAMLEELEDLLISADLGVSTSAKVTAAFARGRFDKEISPEDVRAALADEIAAILEPVAVPFTPDPTKKPFVVLVVGVNGGGKTTTIGKLSAQFRAAGKKVTLAAGDTFRAAAIEQLQIWGERTGAQVIARQVGADSAGLAFDAVKAAEANGSDIVMIDTAGRLQNKATLMAELQKICRVLRKVDDAAPHAVLLVLDATTGQNAIGQVEVFTETCDVTGLVMTKLDGTARGGVLVAIADRFGMPVHAIGVGESAEDLQSFEARDFARALVGFDSR